MGHHFFSKAGCATVFVYKTAYYCYFRVLWHPIQSSRPYIIPWFISDWTWNCVRKCKLFSSRVKSRLPAVYIQLKKYKLIEFCLIESYILEPVIKYILVDSDFVQNQESEIKDVWILVFHIFRELSLQAQAQNHESKIKDIWILVFHIFRELSLQALLVTSLYLVVFQMLGVVNILASFSQMVTLPLQLIPMPTPEP